MANPANKLPSRLIHLFGLVGRNMETPSEDPYINGMYGIAYTQGLQNGTDPRYVMAIPTLKHYDANSLEG